MSKFNMINLLEEEHNLLEEIKELQEKAVAEKQQQEENEAALWLSTPFKEKKLTNDKQRKAYVTQQMSLLYPSFYESYKTQIAQKEARIQWIKETIKVMMFLNIKEIVFGDDDDSQDSDKGDGAQSPVSSTQ